MNAKRCDKCREFYLPHNHKPKYQIIRSKGLGIIDLCPNCSDTLAKWINGQVYFEAFNGEEESSVISG